MHMIGYFMCLFSLISSSILMYMSIYLYNEGFIYLMSYILYDLNGLFVDYLMLIDWVSLMFMGIVLFITSVVFYYSIWYVGVHKMSYNFYLLVFFFVASMLVMILSPSMFSLMLGWDGLGISSYLLIIYYNNNNSINSGSFTMILNRVGDISFIFCIFLCMSLEFFDFYFFSYNVKLFIVFFIFLGCLTKSAQFPFCSWLPIAMSAPTPVSSLVHSSTLVTSGVYVMIRLGNLFNYSYMMYLISLLTLIVSGLSAFYEYDLKKIIALSTLSQLGVMMMIMSFSMVDLCFFHLCSHALFKSLLFMCAGYYMHLSGGFQDIRLMNYNYSWFFFFGLMSFISLLSLCGFPFTCGFFSKDLIFEFIFIDYHGLFFFFLMGFSFFFTFMYSIRLIYYLFFNMGMSMPSVNYDSNSLFKVSIFFLGLTVVFSGSIFMGFFYSLVNIYLFFFFKFFIICMFFIYLYMYMYNYTKLYSFFLFPHLYYMIFVLPYLSITYLMSKIKFSLYSSYIIDMFWLEKVSGKGMNFFFNYCSSFYNLLNLLKLVYFFFFMLFLLFYLF